MDEAAQLVVPAAKAASALFFVFCVGLVFGYFPRPGGLLNAASVRVLAAVVLWLSSPSLLFSSLGRTLTPAVLRDAAAAAAWAVVHLCVSAAAAAAARRLVPPPREHDGAFFLASVWANCMSLPLLLLTSLTARGALRADVTAMARAVQYIFV